MRTVRALLLAVAGGLAFGAASSLVNATRAPWARAVSNWVTNGTFADVAWSLVAFLGGLVVAAAPVRRCSALAVGTVGGVVTVEVAVVAYYLTDTARGVYAADAGGVHWDWVWNDTRVYTQVGLAVGLALGLSGAVARRGGPLRWWALAVLPATFFARGFAFGTLPSLGSRPSTVALALIGLLVLVGLVDVGRHLARRARRRRRDAQPRAAG